MQRLNKRLIYGQLTEVAEELDRIRQLLDSGDRVSEATIEVMFEHLYHHINFAWNVRFATMGQYRNLSDRNFSKWSRFPKRMTNLFVSK